MSRVRAVVADPFPLWRQAIERVLVSCAVEVVASTGSLREASAQVKELAPDLAVIDWEERDEDCDVWLREQREHHPVLKVIVFSARDDSEAITSALAKGVVAYVIKRAQPVEIAAVLRQLERRSIYFGNESEGPPGQHSGNGMVLLRSGLTRRQQEILSLVAEGSSNKEMARSLWVTEQTIKFHLSNIYRKLGVTNRTQASRWAYQRGLLAAEQTASAPRPPLLGSGRWEARQSQLSFEPWRDGYASDDRGTRPWARGLAIPRSRSQHFSQ